MAPRTATPIFNRKLRDSAFTLLFKDKRRVFSLYQSLQPQDTQAKPEDIKISTLQNLWIRGFYNDLSFSIGNRLCVLVESQSRWCPNMPARMLLYYTDLLKKFLKERNIELTSDKLQKLPAPKFFEIYSGRGHEACNRQELTAMMDEDTDMEVTVHLVRSGPRGSILEQYIAFCRIYELQKQRFDNAKEIIQNTIRICLEKGILVDFLTEHADEVEEVMEDQFNQEAIFERIRQEDRKEARQEGRQEGLAIALRELMKNSGYSLEKAMALLAIPSSARAQYEKLLTSQNL